MSFFAGFLHSSGRAPFDIQDSGVRSALGLNAGARMWHSHQQGVISQCQSLITPEDYAECLPTVFDSGRKVLVFDGRIDNRDELIPALRLSPSRSGTLTDSDIVAGAICRWGDHASSHLLGDFAFASWDTEQRRLLLACDQVGGRQIFFRSDGDKITFGTRMNLFWSLPGASLDVDLEYISRLLLDCTPGSGSTPFRSVRLLPAASQLIWKAGGETGIQRYWTPDFHHRIHYSRDEEYVEHARELLDNAVRCRLRAAGPVACHLSGGFDSGGVAATAARLAAPGTISTVTAVPQHGVRALAGSPRAFADESKYAAAVVAMYPNVCAHVAPAAEPVPTDPRVLFHARGMPIRNFLNVSWFGAANEKVRELGAKVLLVGSAGNLTLSWNGSRRPLDLAARGNLLALRREISGLSRQGVRQSWPSIVLWHMLPSWLRQSLRRVRRSSATDITTMSAISPELAGQTAQLLAAENAERVSAPDQDSAWRARLLQDSWRRPGNALLRSYVGFDRRDPLADLRLVEFCTALPSEQFMLDGVTRRLARRVLADRLPAELLRENRKGRQNPDWFYRMNRERERLAESISRLSKSPLASYALNLTRMKAILDQWPEDAAAAEAHFRPMVAVLARGVNTGEFLEWVEGGCIAPAGAV